MSDAERGELHDALQAIAAKLTRERRVYVLREGFVFGLRLMPRLALGLVLGFWASVWIRETEPFAAPLLPGFLALVPLGTAFAFHLRYGTSASLRDAAQASDQQLPGEPLTTAVDAVETGELETEAIDRTVRDALGALPQLQPGEVHESYPTSPLSWSGPALGLVVSLLPALLPLR